MPSQLKCLIAIMMTVAAGLVAPAMGSANAISTSGRSNVQMFYGYNYTANGNAVLKNETKIWAGSSYKLTHRHGGLVMTKYDTLRLALKPNQTVVSAQVVYGNSGTQGGASFAWDGVGEWPFALSVPDANGHGHIAPLTSIYVDVSERGRPFPTKGGGMK